MASDTTFIEQIVRIKEHIEASQGKLADQNPQRSLIEKAVQHTVDTIRISPSKGGRNIFSGSKILTIREQVGNLRDRDLENISDLIIEPYFYTSLLSARETIRHKIGNCGEFAILCAINLLSEGIDNIEFCVLVNQLFKFKNHEFLRIGQWVVDSWKDRINSQQSDSLKTDIMNLSRSEGDMIHLNDFEIISPLTIKFSCPKIKNTIDLFLKNHGQLAVQSIESMSEEEDLKQLKDTIRFHFQYKGKPMLFFESEEKIPEGVELFLQAESFEAMKKTAHVKQAQFIALGRSKATSQLYEIVDNAQSAMEAKQALENQHIISRPYTPS